MKYKFNISHQISLTNRQITIDSITKDLEKRGILSRTFFRDKSILINSEEDMPTKRLLIYADYFGVPITKMLNYGVTKTGKIKRLHDESEGT